MKALIGIGLLTSALLSGCGFQLRGTHTTHILPSSIRAVQIRSETPYGDFYRILSQTIKQYDIALIPNETSAEAVGAGTLILTVSAPQFSERALSYSSDGQVNYVLVEMTLSYEAHEVSGPHHFPSTPVLITRPMSVQPNAFLNNDNQRQLLHQELCQEAAVQILQKLSRLPLPTA